MEQTKETYSVIHLLFDGGLLPFVSFPHSLLV
jgi:hypothetical protein